uniref:DUF4283 domain-containing protein n=1 Tax=Nicotiana tabacum TaxID=4097 RepID=A0A1S3XKU9_TOBAC|nr:PREDICTED: uncharacterized protein LOC107766217 [Nicotiana tabacum]
MKLTTAFGMFRSSIIVIHLSATDETVTGATINEEFDGTVTTPSQIRSPIPEIGEGTSKSQQKWTDVVQLGSSQSKLSWADEFEASPELNSKGSIWDNFDIAKKSVVVCYVLGPHPHFAILNGYVRRLWEKHGINKVSMLKNSIVLVRFDSVAGKNEVLKEGIYHFDNKPFIVKAWNPDMEFTRDELYTVPIWVKLLGLELKYWSSKGLSKTGSLIGKPLMVGNHTLKKVGLSFARLLIEVEMDTPLPKKVYFKNERGLLMEQKVQYDWKLILCKTCKKYGHDEQVCKAKKVQQPHPKGKHKITIRKLLPMK